MEELDAAIESGDLERIRQARARLAEVKPKAKRDRKPKQETPKTVSIPSVLASPNRLPDFRVEPKPFPVQTREDGRTVCRTAPVESRPNQFVDPGGFAIEAELDRKMSKHGPTPRTRPEFSPDEIEFSCEKCSRKFMGLKWEMVMDDEPKLVICPRCRRKGT